MIFRISINLLTLSIISVSGDGDGYCNYSQGHQILTCIDIDLKSFRLDSHITSDTHVLIIKESDNFEIPPDYHTQSNFLHITSYNLLYNGALKISNSAFNGLRSLRYLNINNNRYWPILKSETFTGLEKLEMLSMVNNSIKVLESDGFKGMTDLDVLDLTRNKIKVIPSAVFSSLTHLTSLFLPRNDMQDLEDNCFDGLQQVQLIDLSFNNLTFVKAKTFDGLTNLNDLYLSHNRISHIEGVFNLKNLKFLYLEYNQLVSIYDNFKSLENVKAIDLANNDIGSISDDAFYNLSHLDLLTLRNNSEKSFPNLKFENAKPHVVV